MVQILVAELMTMFGDRPKSDIKIAMARAVIEEFPFLKDEEGQGFEAWYTPGKGLHSATGWLEEKLRNMRRRINQEKNKTNISSSSATVSKSKLVQFTSLPESSISEEDYEGMVEWLKHHVEPLTKVKEFMSKTSVKRASWIREHSDLSVDAILKEHPRLIDTPGMIELDFALVLPESVSDNLFLKWTPSFADKVIKYAEDQAKWQVYLGINMEQINSDEAKQNVALSILPCILPAGRKCKKRCSIDDALSSFIDVKPIGTNIPKYLEDNLKPHILVLGERLHPHQVFLVCEGKCLERSNLVEAVDSCFKLFYVLDMEYPWQSNVTWEFFQKVVYCLEDKTPRKTTSAVISMRATLNSYA
ncbi:Hypothetical predicted protein [Paramuricea clavata]|nr:Hypothetical predicted protein [Paramuricea clavata]